MSHRIPALALSALLLGFGVTAQAATVVGATQVHVTSGDTYLQIAELLAYDFGGVDVAYAGEYATVSALNQYSETSQPINAIDGVYPRGYDSNPGIYHSAGTAGDFLNVFFYAPANLSSLTIYGRTDCCAERDLYNVTIFNAAHELLYSGSLDATTQGFATVNFDRPQGAAVPEPSLWATLVLGFATVGAALRRRRPQAVRARA